MLVSKKWSTKVHLQIERWYGDGGGWGLWYTIQVGSSGLDYRPPWEDHKLNRRTRLRTFIPFLNWKPLLSCWSLFRMNFVLLACGENNLSEINNRLGAHHHLLHHQRGPARKIYHHSQSISGGEVPHWSGRCRPSGIIPRNDRIGFIKCNG